MRRNRVYIWNDKQPLFEKFNLYSEKGSIENTAENFSIECDIGIGNIMNFCTKLKRAL